MHTELHIAGLLVHARPEAQAAVVAGLAARPQVEVRAARPGKLVVVCECASGGAAIDLTSQVRPGVVDVALVYQHAESAVEMDCEIGVLRQEAPFREKEMPCC
jgi:periplasmic nitrate reductase NapD